MQIIVLGAHRSGTSAVTRLINMMGAYFAPEGLSLGFNKDNPKGFWERKDVMNLNNALLTANGCAWDTLGSWDFSRPTPLAVEHRRAMKSILLEMDAHRPWVLKDPRLCLTFAPYWRELLEVPVVVTVTRDPREAAQSLHVRNGLSHAQALAIWEYCAVGMLQAMPGLPVVRVEHHVLLSDPVKAARELYAGLLRAEVQGLRLPSNREITAFIEPKLYRAKETAAITLGAHQQVLWDALRGNAAAAPSLHISEAAKNSMLSAVPPGAAGA